MCRTKHIWHESIHKRFNEQLVYFQLTFLPIYNRKKIFRRIKQLLNDNGICSFCIYEIYGLYDLILRIWLPPSQQPYILFRKKLEEILKDLDCTRVIPFIVYKTHLHWKWININNEDLLPSDIDVKDISKDIIIKIDDNNEDFEDNYSKLDSKHILKKYNPSEGIKFFIVIPCPSIPEIPPKEFEEIFLERIRNIVLKNKCINEPSIYHGDGFAWVLIKGKLQFEYFSSLNTLVQEINEAGVNAFSIRTYTYLVTDSESEYSIEKERISISSEADLKNYDVLHYINKDEDDKFEIKPSLSLDVKRFLRDKTKKNESCIACEGVLKTIVGFLNARGGKLLIGILEASRYEDLLKDPNSILFNINIINNIKIVFGINHEYTPRGWDEYCVRLSSYIDKHIGTDASALITNIRKLEFQGVDLCLVEIPPGKKWYYLDKKIFYVRRANSTIPLEGEDMDAYKKMNPRE